MCFEGAATVRAVIFDLFGTIVDGFASTVRFQDEFATALCVPRDTLAAHWRQLTDSRTLGEFQTIEESIEHVCKLMGATVSVEQIDKAVDCRLRLTRNALTPRPDAISTFQSLKAGGLKIGLLSNCSIEIPIVWPETKLANWFDAAVFSSRERIKKPAPEMYRLACARLGVAAEECVYVADGENFELTAAKEIGMYPVLIRTTESHSESRREAQEWQGATISALPELLPMVAER
jgi:putative hydrolase of the HAD superfamily